MTTDRMPSRPWGVTRPRPQRPPDVERRAARVRPYHRYQEHRQNRPDGPAVPATPMRDRAVLERVLAGLRALNSQPTTQPAVQNIVPPRPVPLPPVVGNSAMPGTGAPPALVAVPDREAPAVSGGSSVRSLLGRQLMPLVRAVLARRPEAALPAAEVEPSPDVVRTQPLRVVEVGS